MYCTLETAARAARTFSWPLEARRFYLDCSTVDLEREGHHHAMLKYVLLRRLFIVSQKHRLAVRKGEFGFEENNVRDKNKPTGTMRKELDYRGTYRERAEGAQQRI